MRRGSIRGSSAVPPGEAGPAAARNRLPWRPLALAGLWLALASAHLLVAFSTPITVWADAGHDDGWFVARAEQWIESGWLGAHDQMTLIKGPGYPLFLVAAEASGVPLALATALFRAVAAALFALAVARATATRWLATPLFALALWHPVALSAPLARVMRDTIYAEQLLLLLGAALVATMVVRGTAARIAWGAAAGAALGWFDLTREEGIWIAPGLVLLTGLAWLRGTGSALDRLRRLVPALVSLALVAAAVNGAFRLGNRIAYGAFVAVDFKEPQFRRALAALYRAGNGAPVARVPVPLAVRRQLAQASPAFATIAESLDPPAGPVWQWGCQFYPSTCGDIAGGWFQWALRDAVAAGGHYATPARASAFFARLADEVDAACARGELRCVDGWIDWVQRPEREQVAAIPARTFELLRWITFRIRPELDPMASSGDPARIAAIADRYGLRFVAPVPASSTLIEGSFTGAGTRAFTAATAGGENVAVDLGRLRERVRGRRLDDPRTRSFRLRLPAASDATIRLESGDGATATTTVAELARAGASIRIGRSELLVERVDGPMRSPADDRRVRAARAVREGALALYAGFAPILVSAGAIAFAAGVVGALRRRTLDPRLGLSAIAWLLVGCRTAVLVLFDVTAFPSIHPLYLTPAYQLVLIAPLLALAAVVPGRHGRRIASGVEPAERAAG